MTILDTSLIIPLFRPGGATWAQRLANEIGELDIFLTSVTQLEVLQGSQCCGGEQNIGGYRDEDDLGPGQQGFISPDQSLIILP